MKIPTSKDKKIQGNGETRKDGDLGRVLRKKSGKGTSGPMKDNKRAKGFKPKVPAGTGNNCTPSTRRQSRRLSERTSAGTAAAAPEVLPPPCKADAGKRTSPREPCASGTRAKRSNVSPKPKKAKAGPTTSATKKIKWSVHVFQTEDSHVEAYKLKVKRGEPIEFKRPKLNNGFEKYYFEEGERPIVEVEDEDTGSQNRNGENGVVESPQLPDPQVLDVPPPDASPRYETTAMKLRMRLRLKFSSRLTGWRPVETD